MNILQTYFPYLYINYAIMKRFILYLLVSASFLVNPLTSSAQWQACTDIKGGSVIDMCAIDPTTFILVDQGNIYKSDVNSGWVMPNDNYGGQNIYSAGNVLFVAPVLSNLYRSMDGGTSWNVICNGEILAFTSVGTSIYYYEYLSDSIVKSDDYGDTNEKIMKPDDGETHGLFGAGGDLYANTDIGFYKLNEDGTWTSLPEDVMFFGGFVTCWKQTGVFT
jgi:hypothetical protein